MAVRQSPVGRRRTHAIMQFLNLTLDTPAENLALDEALLLSAESGAQSGELLRLWEPREFMVVLGSSSRVLDEVRLPTCRQRCIEVLRRSSGGAAILAGPGSLMYALILDRRQRPELRGIDTTHQWVLDTLAAAIGGRVSGVARRGISDLALRERKFSGNSLRVRRDWLLYHGTLLYSFPLRLLDACLGTPPRQPAYRAGRRHSHFVMNLPLDGTTLRETVRAAFECNDPLATWPRELTIQLAAEKFGNSDWTYRL